MTALASKEAAAVLVASVVGSGAGGLVGDGMFGRRTDLMLLEADLVWLRRRFYFWATSVLADVVEMECLGGAQI